MRNENAMWRQYGHLQTAFILSIEESAIWRDPRKILSTLLAMNPNIGPEKSSVKKTLAFDMSTHNEI